MGRLKTNKKIIALSGGVLVIILGVAAIFIYNNRPHTLADVVPFESTEVREISVTYPGFRGMTGYTITDPEKIQEVVDHINTFEYSYIVGPWALSGTEQFLVVRTYKKEYYLSLYMNASVIRIDDVWYVGEENEYFMELADISPMPDVADGVESFLEGAAQRGKLRKA